MLHDIYDESPIRSLIIPESGMESGMESETESEAESETDKIQNGLRNGLIFYGMLPKRNSV